MGSRHFPCDTVVNYLSKTSGPIYYSTLWDNSFGKRKACQKRIFSLPNKVIAEFYLSNESCRRKGTCQPGDFRPWDDIWAYNKAIESEKIRGDVIARAGDIKAFCEQYRKPGDRCVLSIGLESNYTAKASKNLVQWAIEAGWSRKDIAYNPVWGSRDKVSGLYELHGFDSCADINTLDGFHLDTCSGKSSYTPLKTAVVKDWLRTHNPKFFGWWCPGWQGADQQDRLRKDRVMKVYRKELQR